MNAQNNNSSRVAFHKGKRVTLRPPMKEDIPKMHRWINDREVTKYLSSYLPVSLETEEKWFDNLANRKDDIIFCIEVDSVLIGTMGIHHINWKDRVATTGALIGEKEYWGRGFGTEAKILLLEYAFNSLNLRKIYSEVIAYNKRSLHYSLHCGYRQEGRKVKAVFYNGKYHDIICLALFKKDWLPYWKKFQTKT